MRRAAFAWLSVTTLALLPACSDDARVIPLSALWLEWSDSVAAGTPFGVRVRGMGALSDVRIKVRVHADTVMIEPYSVAQSCREYCPPVALLGYDTLVWVPGIAATSASTVTIRAPNHWQAATPPWPLRTFGTVTVAPTIPIAPLMRSVGVGSGFFESAFGCYVVVPGPPFRVYISANQTPDWAPGFTGFVYGHVDPYLLSACLDDAPVIAVDSIR